MFYLHHYFFGEHCNYFPKIPNQLLLYTKVIEFYKLWKGFIKFKKFMMNFIVIYIYVLSYHLQIYISLPFFYSSQFFLLYCSGNISILYLIILVRVNMLASFLILVEIVLFSPYQLLVYHISSVILWHDLSIPSFFKVFIIKRY